MKSRWMEVGQMMGALLLVLAAVLACGKGSSSSSGGGGSSSAASKMGDTVTFDDSDWIVVDAKDLGKNLVSNLDPDDKKTTDGKFVQVHFKVTNKGKKEEMVLDPPKVLDDKGREFGPVDMQSFYVPKNAKTLALDSLPPSMQREYYTIIEVPADAKTLKFEIHGLGMFGDKKTVDLGI